MITIEELSAYNRKLVDMNLKLRKENAELKKKLKEKLKTIADKDLSFVAKFDALEFENAELKERLERAKEIIKDFVDRDNSCWSIQKKAEEFLKECQ